MTTMASLFADYTIEVTARDALTGPLPFTRRPSQVFVPWLPDEDDATRIAACAALHAEGHVPVPHISARRIASRDSLDRLIGALTQEAGVEAVLLIAGDCARPVGDFAESMGVIATGLLERHGLREVAIAGHPDGHPDVAEALLLPVMQQKLRTLAERGLAASVVTQFSFDAARVLGWLGQLRDAGVSVPVRVGIPGPAGVRTLLRFAARCGVSASSAALARYGLSLGRLIGAAGPDRFLALLGEGLAATPHGAIGLHVFPFGGFDRFDQWLGTTLAEA